MSPLSFISGTRLPGGMRALLAAALALGVSLSGCWHQADLAIRVANQTAADDVVRLSITGGGREVLNESYEVPANGGVEGGRIVLKSGDYTFRAWSRDHSAVREEPIGSSNHGVSLWLDEQGIDIAISIT